MKRIFISASFLIVLLFIYGVSAFADFAGCGCYCGKILQPPCGDDDCKRACGWQEPSSGRGAAVDDYEAERQAAAAEAARAAEADRQRRAGIEEQARKEAEEAKQRQIEFEQKKEEALKSMKGMAGDELGLKGVGADSGLGLKGITATDDIGLKGVGGTGPVSADFGLKTLPNKVESRGDRAYPANCGPTVPNRTAPITTDLCPGNLVAMTYLCGGDMGCPYVCCPKGLPFLNHCDCKCYAAENFECPTLSKCEVQPPRQ